MSGEEGSPAAEEGNQSSCYLKWLVEASKGAHGEGLPAFSPRFGGRSSIALEVLEESFSQAARLGQERYEREENEREVQRGFEEEALPSTGSADKTSSVLDKLTKRFPEIDINILCDFANQVATNKLPEAEAEKLLGQLYSGMDSDA